MKRKILHILYSGLGGTTDYVINLIKGDKNFEYEHHIIFYGIETIPENQLILAKELSASVQFVLKKKGYDYQAFKTVFSLITSISPHTITLHVNSLILTCAKYKKAKLVFIEHQSNELKTKKEWLWSLIAQLKADHIVSFTEDYLKILKNRLNIGFSKNKNLIINTGIELSLYSSQKTIEDSTIKVGIISRINNYRDHKTLLKAFIELNITNSELYIAGDGPLKNQLQSKYNKRNIHWLGIVGSNDIITLLSKLDIYVIASFGESTSIALMQAQASGLPIIASNVKGINNVLNHDNCIFVTPKNIQSYKKALQILTTNKAHRDILSEKSSQFANDNLSHFRMFEEYKRIL